METLRASPGLMALLINHLVDLDLLFQVANLPADLENHPRSDKPVGVTPNFPDARHYDVESETRSRNAWSGDE